MSFPLPTDLPVPIDDGASDHLVGMTVPAHELEGTDGQRWDIANVTGRSIVFAYPMTGRPDTPLPDNWDAIPGARGCTPETCAFRDLTSAFADVGARIFGLSTQTSTYQREMTTRLSVPFPVLSDANRAFGGPLLLPTMQTDVPRSPDGPESPVLYRRLTLIVDDGAISHCFYPVFPPDQHASQVLAWATGAT